MLDMDTSVSAFSAYQLLTCHNFPIIVIHETWKSLIRDHVSGLTSTFSQLKLHVR